MNWHYVAHIIRDVFHPHNPVIYYGDDHELINVLGTSEHSIEAWGLYTVNTIDFGDKIKDWNTTSDNPFFSHNFADLFISFNYAPYVIAAHRYSMAKRIQEIVYDNGHIFLVNPGEWASDFNQVFTLKSDLVSEIKRYKMFSQENVMVY